jgi:holliday junction DNA helicase RuvA
MIASLQGKIIDKSETGVVVAVGGIGYVVAVPANELSKLALGQEVFLHTYLVVREDALDLYASQSKEVIAWFRLLLSVKGIGPKSALSIMSLAAPGDLAGAIAAQKSGVLSALGVGVKTAERIVLELKNKALELAGAFGTSISTAVSVDSEALQALEGLGYSREQARAALKETEGEDVSAKVRGALRILGRR